MTPAACLTADQAMVQGLLNAVDCRVHDLAQAGYATLAAPGSPVGSLLTVLLTLYVAFIGYRLILGRAGLKIGDVTISMLKIGLIVALATNGSLFQVLIYDTLTTAPAQLGGLLLSGLQGQGAIDPYLGLQEAFDTLQKSAALFSSRAGGGDTTLQGGPGFAAFAVNSGGMILLLSTLGLVLASKVVLAVLLALTPLVAGLLLFETTRGLVEGWLKAMIALALIPMVATLTLCLELAMLAPSLSALTQMRGLQQFAEFDIGPAVTILTLTLVFGLVMVLAAIALSVVAAGLRLPRGLAGSTLSGAEQAQADGARYAGPDIEPRSRAATIAAAAVALDRREAAAPSMGPAGPRYLTVVSDRGPAAPPTPGGAGAPLGTSFRRNPATRATASSARRDQ
ncbi:type IV secretion system protein [Caulobacter sp. DWR1-3-2b1]|uniref:type IV secretion system protein n=1 Tax=Caulobacter sp. DWR1-3-2b1 TaxID=2804670 RepID=UPI003CEED4AF